MKKQILYFCSFAVIWFLVAGASDVIGGLFHQDWWQGRSKYVVLVIAAVLSSMFAPKLSEFLDKLFKKN